MAPDHTTKRWHFGRQQAESYDRRVSEDTTQYYARYQAVLDAVVQRARVVRGQRVLDIGTGTGALAFRCLAKGAYVAGLDPSEGMLKVAREKAGCNYRVRLVRADDPFLSISYPDASFDAVVSGYAFHHVPRGLHAGCVREMLRVLKPGGWWALGDVAFQDAAAERDALARLSWLEEEYFARVDALRAACGELSIDLSAEQMTPVTWVMWAQKPVEEENPG